jgi:hypothetical protein
MSSDRALEMPLRFCRQAGCANKTRNEGGYCDSHLKDNGRTDYQRLRAGDPINKMYGRAAWTSFRTVVIRQNAICQRINYGQQCTHAATLVHHLISPRVDERRFVDPTNVVALCVNCHPNDEGTPHWKVGVDFVATQFRVLGTYGGTT